MSALGEYKILKKLGKLFTQLDEIQFQLMQMESNMTKELDDLTVEVTEMNDAVDSAITLLEGLSAQLLAIKDDPAKIEALALELDAKSKELAEAVVANTPV